MRWPVRVLTIAHQIRYTSPPASTAAAIGEAMPGSGRSGVVGGWLTHPSSHLRQALVAPNGVLHESC